MIEHLWQSTLCAVGAAILALSLRRNQARVRHGLWLAASLKFLVPFSAIVAAGGLFSWRRPAAITQPAVNFMLDVMNDLARTPGTPTARPFIMATAARTVPTTPSFNFASVAIGVWVAGIVVSLAIWAVRWKRISALAAHGRAIDEGRVVELLRGLKSPRHRALQVVSIRSAIEPGVFGILHPVLLWPEGIGERLDDEQVEAILAHELAHVRRRDNLAAAAHMLVQSVFWFHPLVWWIGARLVDERERACDEDVLRHGSAPHVYAEGILRTCEHFAEAPLACVSGVTGANLKKRISAIMTTATAHALSPARRAMLGAAAAIVVGVPLAAGALQAVPQQTPLPETPLKFEVASVKQNRSGSGMMTLGGGPNGRYNAVNVPLRLLIRSSYQVQDSQIVGGPDWISTDRFDITARAEGALPPAVPGQPGPQQLMVRALLADRFKLVVHRETREVAIYALVVARDDKRLGPQLKPSSNDCSPGARRGLPPPAPLQPGERPACGMRMGPGDLSAGGTTLAQLATNLSMSLGRTVVDKTGLTGSFDFDLKWTPDQLPQGAPPPGVQIPAIDPNGPSIFAALQEQLGLKLESQRGPVDVLVIDSVEHPTEN